MSTTPAPPTTTPPPQPTTTPTALPNSPSASLQLLGVRLTLLTPSAVEARFTVSPAHLQPHRLLHGGVSALIAEEVASIAGQLNAAQRGGGAVVGTRIMLNHVGSAAEGDEVVVTAVPVHCGRQMHLYGIRVEKEGKSGERKLLSVGEMNAFVKEDRNQSKL